MRAAPVWAAVRRWVPAVPYAGRPIPDPIFSQLPVYLL